MPHDGSAIRTAPPTRAALLRLGGLFLLLAATSIVGYKLGWFDYRHTLDHIQRVRRSYSLAVVAAGFVLVYGIGTSVGAPGLPFTVAAGAIFGTVLGSVLAWIGALLGAMAGYLIARTIGHDVVLRWVRRFKKIDTAVVESRDFAGMLRLRLIPIIPLGTVNFVGGLAKAPFGSYMAATAIGVIPTTVIYTYFADSLLEGVGTGRRDAFVSLIVASTLLILLSLTPRFFRRSERLEILEVVEEPVVAASGAVTSEPAAM
jgi:uncharacterized membrane protein YdjX (TVP38/TMEM64 family)